MRKLRGRGVRRGVQGPAFLDALEAMLAALFEPYSGPGDEIPHRARHPDFTGIGQPRYARADMDADPGDVGAVVLDALFVGAARVGSVCRFRCTVRAAFARVSACLAMASADS